MTSSRSYTFRSVDGGHVVKGELLAYWEVESDAISDSYSPDEISSVELFQKWMESIVGQYPTGLIPIHWFVSCEELGLFSYMPLQFNHFGDQSIEGFLNAYSWPVQGGNETRLNWRDLPVIDKLWISNQSTKGGFIQQATGWKPSILQPYVYLPSLVKQ